MVKTLVATPDPDEPERPSSYVSPVVGMTTNTGDLLVVTTCTNSNSGTTTWVNSA